MAAPQWGEEMSEWRERAKRVTPGGSQTRSKRDVFSSVSHAKGGSFGSHVWAEDRLYTDWIAGLASVGLGYNNEAVNEAVIKEIDECGTMLPLPSPLEVETAELLCETLTWPEQVRWVKTGSEATVAAMMIARSYTGRHKIISVGYHGWHAAHQPGECLVDIPWGDTERILAELRSGYVAAVLMEPMRDHEPRDDYLPAVQGACRSAGALFILDEIVTGFRWAIGGAREYYHMEPPDLACFGKAMANGYPLACVVGPRRIMNDHALGVSSTYGGEGVGLAAARATIEVYRSKPVIAHLWHVGRELMHRSPVPMEGFPVHPRFVGTVEERKAICERAAQQGTLFHPAGSNPMYAHTEQDIQRSVEALR